MPIEAGKPRPVCPACQILFIYEVIIDRKTDNSCVNYKLSFRSWNPIIQDYREGQTLEYVKITRHSAKQIGIAKASRDHEHKRKNTGIYENINTVITQFSYFPPVNKRQYRDKAIYRQTENINRRIIFKESGAVVIAKGSRNVQKAPHNI